MQIEQLKTLKQQLPRPWQKPLMERTGRSDTHVSEVMNGKKDDPLVLAAAIEMAEEHKRKKETLLKKLQKVTKQATEYGST